MLSRNDVTKINGVVEEFFKKMTFDVEVKTSLQQENVVSIDLKAEEPQVLIGEKGQTLSEIQHLLKIILRKITEEPFFINLDINDYKKKKTEYLKEMARSVADEVALNKKEKQLFSMSAFERRVVHMEIADRQDIITESIGQEPDRRILIKSRS